MEDDKLKKLIRTMQPDEPGADFTDNIMKIVAAEDALKLSPALLSALKNELLAEPSLAFSDHIMAAIQPAAAAVTEPVISKKTGLIISGFALALLLVALLGSHYSLSHSQGSPYLSGLNLSGTTAAIVQTATTILPYIIPLSILLLADYFFRTRRHQLTISQ